MHTERRHIRWNLFSTEPLSSKDRLGNHTNGEEERAVAVWCLVTSWYPVLPNLGACPLQAFSNVLCLFILIANKTVLMFSCSQAFL
jgi:hypothetical protein